MTKTTEPSSARSGVRTDWDAVVQMMPWRWFNAALMVALLVGAAMLVAGDV